MIQESIFNSEITITKTIVCAAVLLPVLSFAGWWDMYLSGALYSGNVAVGAIRINEETFRNLPPKEQGVVFRTESANEQILPLHEWSLAELNVPVYPERRIFRKIIQEICRLSKEKNQVELIMKARPGIFDGSFRVERTACSEFAPG